MCRRIMVLGFCIIVMILTAGCTSPQNEAVVGSKIQDSRTETIAPDTQSPGFFSPPTPSPKMCWPTPDMTKYRPFFPDMAGYRREYNGSSNGLNDILGNEIEERYSGSNFSVMVRIMDYTLCDVEPNDPLKNARLGETQNNVTISSVNSLDYHGYPSTRIEVINNEGEMVGIVQSVIINQKIILGIAVYSPLAMVKSMGMSINLSVLPKSEFNAETDAFLNALDINRIATAGNTPDIIKPISLTARYNPDGTITVTNNGGTATADLSVIRVSVNGGKLRDKLDPQAGSSVTVQGIAGAKNRITAVGTFRNGTYAVVLDTNVGPNP